MSSYENYTVKSMAKPIVSPLQQVNTYSRRQSTSSNSSPTLAAPRVQLVPHSRTSSYDGSLSPADIELLANTNFDSKDMSSRDFDFEDVFTYDKPQRKLKSVVEVSSPSRDLSSSSFSHYSPIVSKPKYNRKRSTASEMYMKNNGDARRR